MGAENAQVGGWGVMPTDDCLLTDDRLMACGQWAFSPGLHGRRKRAGGYVGGVGVGVGGRCDR